MYQFPRGPQQSTSDRVAYAAEIYFLTILESRNEIKMSLKLISSDASSLTEDGLPLSVFTWSSLYTCVCVCTFSHDHLFAAPWTVPARLLCPWNFPGKNTGVDCCYLLQGIFLTQGWNPQLWPLPHWQKGSLPLMSPGKPCLCPDLL